MITSFSNPINLKKIPIIDVAFDQGGKTNHLKHISGSSTGLNFSEKVKSTYPIKQKQAHAQRVPILNILIKIVSPLCKFRCGLVIWCILFSAKVNGLKLSRQCAFLLSVDICVTLVSHRCYENESCSNAICVIISITAAAISRLQSKQKL